MQHANTTYMQHANTTYMQHANTTYMQHAAREHHLHAGCNLGCEVDSTQIPLRVRDRGLASAVLLHVACVHA